MSQMPEPSPWAGWGSQAGSRPGFKGPHRLARPLVGKQVGTHTSLSTPPTPQSYPRWNQSKELTNSLAKTRAYTPMWRKSRGRGGEKEAFYNFLVLVVVKEMRLLKSFLFKTKINLWKQWCYYFLKENYPWKYMANVTQVLFLAEKNTLQSVLTFFLESHVMRVWGEIVNISIPLSHGVDTMRICGSGERGEGLYSLLGVFWAKSNRWLRKAVPRSARSPDASRARLHRWWATCPGEGHFTCGLTLSFPEEKQQPRACGIVARIT